MDGPTLDPGARPGAAASGSRLDLPATLGSLSSAGRAHPRAALPQLSSVLAFSPRLVSVLLPKARRRGDASRVSGLGTKMAQAIPWRRWGTQGASAPLLLKQQFFLTCSSLAPLRR